MTALIEVKVADLAGEPLNWAVGIAEELNMYVAPTVNGVPARAFVNRLRGETVYGQRYDPVNDWATGGPLIHKYKVLLTPPTDLVHRNFGPFDPRNGWDESGLWGSTIFGKERKHRRTAFHHPDSPLIVVCRAIVQFELGETVSVPAELMP